MATKSLTYAELAEVWGVSKEAARKKVEALHLPRSLGNDGRARVMIDLEEIQHEPQKPKASDRTPPGDRLEEPEAGHLLRLVSTLEAEVARLAALNVTGRTDLEREQGRGDALVRELAEVREALAVVGAARDAEAARAGQVAVLNAVLELERERLAEARQEAERWREAATAPRGLAAILARLRRPSAA